MLVVASRTARMAVVRFITISVRVRALGPRLLGSLLTSMLVVLTRIIVMLLQS